jgi:hypothetical protein
VEVDVVEAMWSVEGVAILSMTGNEKRTFLSHQSTSRSPDLLSSLAGGVGVRSGASVPFIATSFHLVLLLPAHVSQIFFLPLHTFVSSAFLPSLPPPLQLPSKENLLTELTDVESTPMSRPGSMAPTPVPPVGGELAIAFHTAAIGVTVPPAFYVSFHQWTVSPERVEG